MEDNLLATLSLSKEVLDKTPQKVVDLLIRLLSLRQTCRLRGKRMYPSLVEVFECPLAGGKPVALFSDAPEACHSLNSARSLLSLKLLNYTYALLRKQPWQSSAGAAFCLFQGLATSGSFLRRRKRDALWAIAEKRLYTR